MSVRTSLTAPRNARWFESPPGDPRNTQPFSITGNSVEDMYYLTWTGSYALQPPGERSTELFWVVNNLLDSDPPIAPFGNNYPTNPIYFDTIGRQYRVGVRLEF